jgi:hypothetical protein
LRPAMRLILSFVLIALAQVFPCADIKAQTQTPACPEIRIRNKRGSEIRGAIVIYPGMEAKLTADVPGLSPEDEPTFNWTISKGKIVGGQGTSTVTVLTDLDMGHELTVGVEVGGVSARSPQCASSTSEKLRVHEYFCPSLSINCPTDWQPGLPVSVFVNVSGGDPDVEAKYNWMVSAGTIISGQGTPTITIDTTALSGNSVTATVEVEGFPPECDRTESCTLPPICVLTPNRLFDEYGDLSRAQEEERLAQFSEALRVEPGAQGYIFYYGPRGVDQRLGRAQKFLESKFGIDPTRIKGVNAGHSKEFEVQLWIRPTGSPEPVPTPLF